MSKFWSLVTQRLEPYVPGEQPKDKKYVKLNTNENPYPPSPHALTAMQGAINADLRLYPTPVCEELRETIAKYYGLESEEVFVGNGSDEVLAFAFQAFFDPGRTILFPDITYSFYPVYAGLYDLDYRLIPLREAFTLATEEFGQPNGGIVIPNPNAPTGRGMLLDEVEQILRRNPDSVVIIDEAYIDFGGETAAGLVREYPNLLVVQTLSKSRSLAGLRVGFALGNQDLIAGLERVKNSFNSYTLDRVALAGAVAAITDEAYFQACRTKVMDTRERTAQQLQTLGFIVLPSQANFIFISHPAAAAAQLYQQLREKGYLVRYFNKPRISEFLRVTVGTEEEMAGFIEAITQLVP